MEESTTRLIDCDDPCSVLVRKVRVECELGLYVQFIDGYPCCQIEKPSDLKVRLASTQ